MRISLQKIDFEGIGMALEWDCGWNVRLPQAKEDLMVFR
jgi:hypothetical protein